MSLADEMAWEAGEVDTAWCPWCDEEMEMDGENCCVECGKYIEGYTPES